jgi:hypothetical protein
VSPRWVENRVCADSTAAEELCDKAGLEYSWSTAVYLADAITHGDTHLLSDSTNARLRQYNRRRLQALAEDVLS